MSDHMRRRHSSTAGPDSGPPACHPRRMRGPVPVLVALATTARAAPNPEIEALAKALPAGWHLAVTGTDLTISRTDPVRIGGRHLPNEPGTGNIPVVARGPEI